MTSLREAVVTIQLPNINDQWKSTSECDIIIDDTDQVVDQLSEPYRQSVSIDSNGTKFAVVIHF